MNFKQEELINLLFEKLKKKYPKIKLMNVTQSPENPVDLWINIFSPMNEEKTIELHQYGARLATDILLKYGYLFLIMPFSRQELNLAQKKTVTRRINRK
jgi:hypothetical protein